jgi:hypothetical protein
MRFAHNKLDGTFLIGATFSNYYHEKKNMTSTSLIFDIGSHSFAIIFRGEY